MNSAAGAEETVYDMNNATRTTFIEQMKHINSSSIVAVFEEIRKGS